LASAAFAVLDEPPDDELVESLPPHATTPINAAASTAPTTTRLMTLLLRSHSAQMCASRPSRNVSVVLRHVKEPDIDGPQ
jgi:hypothetical protein